MPDFASRQRGPSFGRGGDAIADALAAVLRTRVELRDQLAVDSELREKAARMEAARTLANAAHRTAAPSDVAPDLALSDPQDSASGPEEPEDEPMLDELDGAGDDASQVAEALSDSEAPGSEAEPALFTLKPFVFLSDLPQVAHLEEVDEGEVNPIWTNATALSTLSFEASGFGLPRNGRPRGVGHEGG